MKINQVPIVPQDTIFALVLTLFPVTWQGMGRGEGEGEREWKPAMDWSSIWGEIENKTRLFHAKETGKSSGNDES